MQNRISKDELINLANQLQASEERAQQLKVDNQDYVR